MTRAIIGGGIAGCALMESLLSAAQEVELIHDRHSLMGSLAPTALFHPFPGRSLRPHRLLEQAVERSLELLQLWRNDFPNLLRFCNIERPLLGRSGDRLRKTYNSYWHSKNSSKWLQLLGPQPSEHPWINAEVIEYRPADTEDLGTLLPLLWEKWEQQGLLHSATVNSIQRNSTGWWVQCSSGAKLGPYESITFAIGASLRQWFPMLPVNEQGGELVMLRASSPGLSTIVSSNGVHIGPHHSGGMVAGATRWGLDERPHPSSAAAKIEQKLRFIMPGLPQCEVHSVWSGVRCNYSVNRLPSAGLIPHSQGLSVLGTLGSKGLLWGPLAAHQLAKLLVCEATIDPEFELSKLTDKADCEDIWQSPHISITAGAPEPHDHARN